MAPAIRRHRHLGDNWSPRLTGPGRSGLLACVSTRTAGPVELSYRSYGEGNPVLFLPPAAARSDVWLAHQVPAVVAAGWRAILVENRGIPPSPAPPGPYRLADLADDTAGLIGRLGLAPCCVVGASLGAMIAQETAARHPELLQAVALVGTRRRADLFRQMLTRAAVIRMLATARPTESDVLAQLAQMFGPATLADERAVADWAEVIRRNPVRGAGPAAQYQALIGADQSGLLGQVSVPCLVVAFGADLVTPPASCREVAGTIPGCGYVEIPDAGHMGFLERPAAVNNALLAFFASAVARPGC
jgi:pimeloyl-ACP methyl ester carboxylesterase